MNEQHRRPVEMISRRKETWVKVGRIYALSQPIFKQKLLNNQHKCDRWHVGEVTKGKQPRNVELFTKNKFKIKISVHFLLPVH